MLDQVLKIDAKQQKALIRKCTCFIELVDFDKATQILKKLQDIAYESEPSVKNTIELEIKKLKAKMNKNNKSEAEFAKNIFANKDGLYKEKAPAKTKEEEAKEKEI